MSEALLMGNVGVARIRNAVKWQTLAVEAKQRPGCNEKPAEKQYEPVRLLGDMTGKIMA